jgi:hypothetical protein
MATEGVGLYRRRRWARWFTIGATGSLMPLELYEIVRAPRPLRMVILLVNIAVVGYLWQRKEVFEEEVRPHTAALQCVKPTTGRNHGEATVIDAKVNASVRGSSPTMNTGHDAKRVW